MSAAAFAAQCRGRDAASLWVELRCTRQYCGVTDPDPSLHSEAKKLQLARASASPEAWRARAAAAGGFLSAAAVVSLLGLAQQSLRLTMLTKATAVAATVFYAMSVLSFLAAVVWRLPKAPVETSNFTKDFLELAAEEAKPIKIAVWIGSVLAGLGVVCTASSAVSVVVDPAERHVWISIAPGSAQEALKQLCPGLNGIFEARVSDGGTNYLEVHVPAKECGGRGSTISLLRSDVVLLDFEARR